MDLDPGLLQKVRAHGTQAGWHYCRSNALPSIIREGAIYSRAELIRRGIPFDPTHYYGTQRHEKVLGEYVSGAALPPWGMMQYAFARSTCATRDGILLRTLDGSGWALCYAQRRLVCQAVGRRHGKEIAVACGRIGDLGFVGGDRIAFSYRLRTLI